MGVSNPIAVKRPEPLLLLRCGNGNAEAVDCHFRRIPPAIVTHRGVLPRQPYAEEIGRYIAAHRQFKPNVRERNILGRGNGKIVIHTTVILEHSLHCHFNAI